MRILLVLESSGGGAGRHVVDLARGLIDHDHDVTVAYSDRRAEPHALGELDAVRGCRTARVDMWRRPTPLDLLSVRAMRRLHATAGPFDVAHGHSSKAGAIARLSSPPECARVYTPHCFHTIGSTGRSPAAMAYRTIERQLSQRSTDALIAVSHLEADHALQLGVPADRLHTIPNGIAPQAPLSRQAARARLSVNDDAKVLGFVGRLCAQKDPLRFVRVLARSRAHDPRTVGVMIGYGPLAEPAVALADALGVRDAIRIARDDNASTLMSAFDVYCMTSRADAMPYTLLEALACSVPVVTTEVGGVAELVEHGVNGYVLPVNASAGELAAHADAILSSEPRRTAFAAQALAKAAHFSAARMVLDTAAVYEQAVRIRKEGGR